MFCTNYLFILILLLLTNISGQSQQPCQSFIMLQSLMPMQQLCYCCPVALVPLEPIVYAVVSQQSLPPQLCCCCSSVSSSCPPPLPPLSFLPILALFKPLTPAPLFLPLLIQQCKLFYT